MRIVHVTDTYPPRTHPLADQVAGLARAQGARGDAVHVLAATPLETVEPGRDRFRTSTTDAPGVRVHRMASRLAMGLPVLPRGRATVERALGLLRPDVIHLHLPGPSPFGYDAARAVRAMDLPLVISAYSATDETLAKYALRISGWATAPVVTTGVTPEIAAYSAEIFGDDAARHLPLGLDPAPWANARDRWEPSDDLRILVHAGNEAKHANTALTDVLAEASEHTTVTAIGPRAKTITGAEAHFGDAPPEVFAPLAATHDAYLPAHSLDVHAAGAKIAGLITVGDDPQDLIDLARDPHLRTRRRVAALAATGGDTPPCAWESILTTADGLYALARERVGGYFFTP